MSDEVPVTKEEVDKLVSTAPDAHTTEALITVAKGGANPTRVVFLKWLSALMFLVVIVIAMVSLIAAKNTNNSKAECRAVIAGALNIANDEGVIAGNNYSAILGDAIIAALDRTPTDPTLAARLADARDLLRATKANTEAAIQRQRDILKICH